MPRRWSMPAVFAALSLAVSISACSDGVLPTPTESLLGPSATVTADATAGEDGYTLVRSRAARQEREVSRTFGPNGGTLRLSGHMLVVPGNVVDSPTEFTLRVRGDGIVGVHLTATQIDENGNEIDVGANGFNKPVVLQMSYASATNIDDPSKLLIVRLTDGTIDGALEPLPSTVATRGRHVVTQKLYEFSAFCMAMN